MDVSLHTPLTKEQLKTLHIGDMVFINGTIYSARDAAHARMAAAMDKGEPLPFDFEGNLVYYLGPSPAKDGRPVGAAGPTTSSRMDRYTPRMLDMGLSGMIGKGRRSEAVMDSIVKNGAVYFAAVGGAAALLSERILSAEIIAYDDLGTEAVRKLEVKDFPVIVVADSHGGNLYDEAVKQYAR